VLTNTERNKIIQGCIDSNEIRELYDAYIKKEIPYEKWVRGVVNRALNNREKQDAHPID
jgi:hypothetical protein